MTRPKDMGPADLAPNTAPPETLTPEDDRIVQRNAFYNGLPPGDKELFLEVLERCAERGMEGEAAWLEAVRAVEQSRPG